MIVVIHKPNKLFPQTVEKHFNVGSISMNKGGWSLHFKDSKNSRQFTSTSQDFEIEVEEERDGTA